MNTIEPCAPNFDYISQIDHAMTVDEVAAIDELNRDTSFFKEVEAITRATSPAATDITSKQELPSSEPDALQKTDLKIVKRYVSGRYSSCPRPWKLELRVDVDGYKPCKMISGDYYYVSGSTTTYFGSFQVETPRISVSDTQIVITGIATQTWTSSYNRIQVLIPKHTIFQPAANAYVQWSTEAGNKGAQYVCLYESAYFRTLKLEEDQEESVVPFQSYDTGSLPSGGSARTLTVAKAYAEAGIQMQATGATNVIPTSEAGANHEWSNAELHDAMESHFSLWKDDPQWVVWSLHANAHEYGVGLRGIMYDQKDKQRQGCASFYQAIDSGSAQDLREQLYVNIHELGHCFNLFHSFHKEYMDPPLPNRPGSLSWMNYPQNYNNGTESGANAFWAAFPFQFDSQEVIHLRHAFRNNIIMGGNPFGEGAAHEHEELRTHSVVDKTGLKLSLKTPTFVPLGTPINIELRVENSSQSSQSVYTDLDPSSGFTQILIKKPNGSTVSYHPPMCQLVVPQTVRLAPSDFHSDSAYIGFDALLGQIFDLPGAYQIFASLTLPSGESITSPLYKIRINAPIDQNSEELAELLLGDQQGMLFYLGGSRSDSLKAGQDAFNEILERFPNNPLTAHVKLVEGLKYSKDFFTLDENRNGRLIKKNEDQSDKLLTDVAELSDNVSNVYGMTQQCVERAQQRLAEIKTGVKAKKPGKKPSMA